MNESLYQRLIWETKATDKMIHPFEAKKGQCQICLQNAFRKCCEEHPEWFTLKTKAVRSNKQVEVEKYLRAVPETDCIVIDLPGCGCCQDEEEIGICVSHALVFVKRCEQKGHP